MTIIINLSSVIIIILYTFVANLYRGNNYVIHITDAITLKHTHNLYIYNIYISLTSEYKSDYLSSRRSNRESFTLHGPARYEAKKNIMIYIFTVSITLHWTGDRGRTVLYRDQRD